MTQGTTTPGLQPADLLRRHTEQHEINTIPSKTAVVVHRTRIARKSGAQQTSSFAHLWSVLFQNHCAVRCHHMSPGETTLHLPVKKMSEAPSTKVPKLQVEESTSFSTIFRSPSAHRGSRGLGRPPSACSWVWFRLETNIPKFHRAKSQILMPDIYIYIYIYMCQKVTVCTKLPWSNLRRGAALGGPKTHHRDGNHATRKAKALVPPWDEVTSQLRRKTKQKPCAMAMRALAGMV